MSLKMGIGKLGNFEMPKRRFRWTAEVTSQDGKTTYLKKTFVKVTARPYPDEKAAKKCSESNDYEYQCVYEEKQKVAFTIFDARTESYPELYKWLAEVYDFNGEKKLSEIATKLTLRLYDGCGVVMESFVMSDVFPTSINFGNPGYSVSEELEIELTLAYTEVEFKNEWERSITKKD